MNFSKLSKYFSGRLPNSQKLDISEFVKILGNLDIDGDFISEYGVKFGSMKADYEGLFGAIKDTENGESKIYEILKYFELSRSFLEVVDYEKSPITFGEYSLELSVSKEGILKQLNSLIMELNRSNKNKRNGNEFEEFCESFLLQSSYFEAGFKEFEFEDGTEKIDRLLRLKKDIGNFGKNTNYLGYVILESKYKKEKEVTGKQSQNPASEVSQLESYIKRLHKYGISKYAIVITSSQFKNTYITKIGDYCREKVIEANPFYLALITVEEIKKFLENTGNYENMSFDQFIERSFIKWLK